MVVRTVCKRIHSSLSISDPEFHSLLNATIVPFARSRIQDPILTRHGMEKQDKVRQAFRITPDHISSRRMAWQYAQALRLGTDMSDLLGIGTGLVRNGTCCLGEVNNGLSKVPVL